MKKIALLVMIVALSGCSIPASVNRSEIYAFSSQEKKLRGGFDDATYELVKDFRGYEMYPEDIEALRKRVETFISSHQELSESQIDNLRKLKIVPGASKEEVLLLLGEPTKVASGGSTWIYRINKLRAFTFFIVPVFIAHEGYYLRFDGQRLVAIERHYPEQMMHQASGPGVIQSNTSD